MKRVDLGKLAEEITYLETYCAGQNLNEKLQRKKRKFRTILARRRQKEIVKNAKLIAEITEVYGKPRFRVPMRSGWADA